MNYIELINNFWVSNKIHGFGALEMSLYFLILDHANTARWPGNFVIPNGVIESVFECSKGQLSRARKKLCEAGLIAYEGGDRFNPGRYSIPALLTDTRYVPDACSMDSSCVTEKEDLGSSIHRQDDKVEKQPLILDESPTRSGGVPDSHLTLPNNINKTKLNKTKQEDSISPCGETKTLFSNPEGEGIEVSPLRIETSQANRETTLHLMPTDKSTKPVASETIPAHEALPSEQEKTFPPEKVEGELARRQDQKEIDGNVAIEKTEEEALDCEEYDSCSRFERDVIETWEVLIGPFETHWIPLLRETLTKCYPSQVKNAIIAIDRSKHEVLMERGFEYIMQPLLNGTFGRRVKKNGRNDWYGSGSFRDPIEKFKNPAKEKPKTREELLKYTTY